MSKENKRKLVQTSTSSPACIYTCVLSTPHGIYVNYHFSTSGFLTDSPGVSSRHPGSHPSTPHTVCVCVRTHTHTTHTHQPPVKNWETISIPRAQTNPSHWKQTPTVDQLEKPRSPSSTVEIPLECPSLAPTRLSSIEIPLECPSLAPTRLKASSGFLQSSFVK